METKTKNQTRLEARLRRRLNKYGYRLQKSRIRNTNIDNFGGYRISDLRTCFIILGSRYEFSLKDVEEFISYIQK
jgi:hypothetical protein